MACTVLRSPVLAAGLILATMTACLAQPAGPIADGPIEIDSVPVPSPEGLGAGPVLGALEWAGGLHLRSDAPGFGGLSSLLAIDSDGGHLALTDEGGWFRARILFDAEHRLRSVDGAVMGAMLNRDGIPFEDKRRADQEAMMLMPDGTALVTFERVHRIARYRMADGQPIGAEQAFPSPGPFEGAPENAGMEAAAILTDGRLMVLTEAVEAPRPAGFGDAVKAVRGWVGPPDGSDWQPLTYMARDGYSPVDAAVLPAGGAGAGDLVVLERRYRPFDGVRVRLRRLPAGSMTTDAVLDGELLATIEPPWPTDNYEGLALRRLPDGRVAMLLISDDNFNSVAQRTLLIQLFMRD